MAYHAYGPVVGIRLLASLELYPAKNHDAGCGLVPEDGADYATERVRFTAWLVRNDSHIT